MLPELFYQGGCGGILFIAATVAAGAGDAVFLMVKCPSSPAIPTAPESRRLFNNAAAHTGADSDHNNVRTVSGSTLPLLADDCAVGVIGNLLAGR